eukprot:5110612-Amphidinium_carterae.1
MAVKAFALHDAVCDWQTCDGCCLHMTGRLKVYSFWPGLLSWSTLVSKVLHFSSVCAVRDGDYPLTGFL